jgi:uncharacterized membrane protein YagU involved in acid resistance
MDYKKGILSGIVAGIVLLVLGFIMSMIYPAYSEWYMKVFAEMDMTWMWIATMLTGIFMGLIYAVINKSIPGKDCKKGFNYGVLVWLLAGVMWPIMAIGYAPIMITIYDLFSGFVMYGLAGVALSKVYAKF